MVLFYKSFRLGQAVATKLTVFQKLEVVFRILEQMVSEVTLSDCLTPAVSTLITILVFIPIGPSLVRLLSRFTQSTVQHVSTVLLTCEPRHQPLIQRLPPDNDVSSKWPE